LIRVRGFRRRTALLAVSGLLSSLPMFLLVSGATTELREVRPTFDSPVRAFGHELSSNVQTFAEVLVPRTTRVSAAGWGIDLLAWLVLAGVVAITLRAYARSGAAPPDPSPGEGRPLSELAFVATTVAASYAVMLAGLSLFFGYEWSLVYRVQGFALPWMIVGACGAALGLASSA